MSVLIIAGLDSSTGAGIARDLAVLADHGIAARVAATAVTAQDSAGLCHVHAVPPDMVVAQIRAAGPMAVAKLGMLVNAGIVAAIADALLELPFVLDPVLATSAGAVLLDAAGRAAMIARLFPRGGACDAEPARSHHPDGLCARSVADCVGQRLFCHGRAGNTAERRSC